KYWNSWSHSSERRQGQAGHALGTAVALAVVGFAAIDIGIQVALPAVVFAGAVAVVPQVLHVPAIGGAAGGGVRAQWGFHHAGDRGALEGAEAGGRRVQFQALDHFFGGHEALLGSVGDVVVEIHVVAGNQG